MIAPLQDISSELGWIYADTSLCPQRAPRFVGTAVAIIEWPEGKVQIAVVKDAADSWHMYHWHLYDSTDLKKYEFNNSVELTRPERYEFRLGQIVKNSRTGQIVDLGKRRIHLINTARDVVIRARLVHISGRVQYYVEYLLPDLHTGKDDWLDEKDLSNYYGHESLILVPSRGSLAVGV